MTWTSLFWMAVAAVAAVAAGEVVAGWLSGLLRSALERSGLEPAVRRVVVQAVRPLVVGVAFVAAASYLGADMSGLVAVLGAATLSVGLALRSSLSNLASGGILLTLRPYREGDRVEVAGQVGVVTEQGLYATTVRTADGALTTLPNDLVLGRDIHNLTRLGRRRVELTLAVPADELEAELTRLAALCAAEARALQDPPAEVLVTGHDARGAILAIRAWVPPDLAETVRSDLYRAALARPKSPTKARRSGASE